ncbi:MFS transporter [Rhodococcus sp. WS4]|nr:MFS transporter [Rhodococcus sp. WS4]
MTYERGNVAPSLGAQRKIRADPIGGSATDPRSGRPATALHAILLLSAGCMSPLGAVLIAPVLPRLSEEYASHPGASFLVPAVLTAPALMVGLIAPFAGWIIDRLGRKRILVWALVIYSVLGVAPLFLDSLPAIVATRAGVGVMEAAIATCATTLITDYYSGNRRNRYLGLNALFAAVAAAIFLTIGGILGENGWRVPFWLYLAGVVIAVPIAFVIFEPKSDHVHGKPRTLVPPIPTTYILFPIFASFLTGIALFSVVVELPYVLTNLGITSSSTIGILTAMTSAGTALGAFLFRRLAVIRVAVLVPVSLGIAGLGIVLIWAAQVTDTGATLAVSGSVLSSFAVGVLIPATLGWGVARLLVEQRGRAIGRTNSALFVGQFIAPIVITWLVMPLGRLEVALGAIGSVIVLVAVVLAGLLSRRDEPKLTETQI